MGLGGWEALVVLLILLLLFGGRRLPQLARSIGDSLRELRQAVDEDTSEVGS